MGDQDFNLTADPTATVGTIAGSVAVDTNSDGEGNGDDLPDVEVMISGPTEGKAPTITGSSGEYSFVALASGRYTLTFVKVGFITQSKQFTLEPGTPLIGANVGLQSSSAVIEGNAQAGTDGGVVVTVAGGVGGGITTSRTNGAADEIGDFRVEGLIPGTYSVSFTKPGFIGHTTQLTLKAGEENKTLSAIKLVAGGRTITGKVTVGSTGLGGVTVSVLGSDTVIQGITIADDDAATTDVNETGTYSLSNVPPGTLTLVFEKRGYLPETSKITDTDAVADQVLTLNPSVTGTICDTTGAQPDASCTKPVRGALVALTGATGNFATLVDNANGNFTIAGVPLGVYSLTVTAPGFAPHADSITQTNERKNIVNKEIKLPLVELSSADTNLGSIQGSVTDASTTDTNLPGVLIVAVDGDGNAFTTVSFPSTSGINYVLSGLPPLASPGYTVTFSVNQFETSSAASGAVTAGAFTRLDKSLRPREGEINGFVTQALVAGEALPGITVSVKLQCNVEPCPPATSVKTTSSDASNYSIKVPSSADAYTVTFAAETEDWLTETRTVTVGPNDRRTILPIVLTHAERNVNGLAVHDLLSTFGRDLEAVPIEGIMITMTGTGDRPSAFRPTERSAIVSDVDGAFTVFNLPVGDYDVAMVDPSGAFSLTGDITVEPGTSLLVPPLNPPFALDDFVMEHDQDKGWIIGRLNADWNMDRFVLNATVSLLEVLPDDSSNLIAMTTTHLGPNVGGTYGLFGIEPGSYTLEIDHGRYVDTSVDLVVTANQETRESHSLLLAPARLTGNVINACTSLGLVGATVTPINPPVGTPSFTTVLSSGRYAFDIELATDPVDPILLDVSFEATDFVTQVVDMVTFVPGMTTALLDVVLEDTAPC